MRKGEKKEFKDVALSSVQAEGRELGTHRVSVYLMYLGAKDEGVLQVISKETLWRTSGHSLIFTVQLGDVSAPWDTLGPPASLQFHFMGSSHRYNGCKTTNIRLQNMRWWGMSEKKSACSDGRMKLLSVETFPSIRVHSRAEASCCFLLLYSVSKWKTHVKQASECVNLQTESMNRDLLMWEME